MELYRPVTAEEYAAVEALHFAGFPPRESGQQLFTALLSEEGAVQIARHLRTEKSAEGDTSYVLAFLAEDSYIRQFTVQSADSPERRSLWIPAEEVGILNQHLIGKIRVVGSYEIDRTGGDIFFV